jgi:hypothetical protein
MDDVPALWFRLTSDPGSQWFRALVMNAYAELQRRVGLLTTGRHLVRARRPRPRKQAATKLRGRRSV